MDVVSVSKNTFSTKTQITAADIPFVVDHYDGHISALSLDCFDTLLWRKTAAPKDVFYDMQHREAFSALGVTAYQRMAAAARAYRSKLIKNNHQQITLQEIYQGFTALTAEQQNSLIEEELKAEIEACYAFAPFMELIREAKKRGLRIVIVSDMYLTSQQLQTLLNHHLPQDVMQAVEKIFCSADYGTSKSENLFAHVLEHLSLLPEKVLHIGDHAIADHDTPKKQGLKALHFNQFNEKVSDFLRVQHSSSALAFVSHPAPNYKRQARYSPFRGVFSQHNPLSETPQALIGYMTFGPMLFAFARFITDELTTLKQAGKNVKPVFLLRDAYLLYRACEAYAGKPVGDLARIRKFVAVAASFRTQEDVDHYMSSIAPQHYNMWVICEQLLLPHDIIMDIIQRANQSQQAQTSFYQLIHQPHILQLIFKNSADARAKLKKYMLKEMHVEPGDTLVLIDTGYMGVTQEFLTRALGEELKIEIMGRYFIASHEPDRPNCKALMTSSWCDHTLFEQSCTYKEGSVLGYDDNGDPIFDQIKLSDQQYAKVAAIQDEVVRFIRDAKHFFDQANTDLPYEMLQRTAEAALHRHIFFPTEDEIHYFQDFQHDKDMGDDKKKTVYNIAAATTHAAQARKLHPYEMRTLSLESSLSSLMKRAFDLEFVQDKPKPTIESVVVAMVKEPVKNMVTLDAVPSTEGFFQLQIVVAANFHVGIIFGANYEWLQIDNIQLLNHSSENLLQKDNRWLLMGMKGSKTLFNCETKEALLLLLPQNETSNLITYQISFRPILRWEI